MLDAESAVQQSLKNSLLSFFTFREWATKNTCFRLRYMRVYWFSFLFHLSLHRIFLLQTQAAVLRDWVKNFTGARARVDASGFVETELLSQ